MPCNKCNHSLVYYEKDPLCPKCESLAILDTITAIEVAERRTKQLEKLLNNYLVTLDKQSLLAHVTSRREMISRKFFKEYSVIDLGEFLSDTLLLKRAILFEKKDGQKILKNEDDAKKLLEFYRDAVGSETDHLQIKLCYAQMMYLEKFDKVDDLTDDQANKNFRIVQNEKYIDLMKSYENYGLVTAEEGEKKIQGYQAEFDELMKEKPEIREHTREEFIKRNYKTICAFYIGLLRNQLFASTFDLRDYSQIISDPHQLSEFVSSFVSGEGGITACPTAEFLIKARKFFKKKIPFLRKILLFEEENPDAFPLFIRIKNEKFDNVFISHAFTAFIYIVLHAIITKNLFDAETERQGHEFEKRVKEEFEKLGFSYQPNQTDKKKNSTLEIDGVALKNNVCYVVECKNHLLPKLVEESNKRTQIVRDLKGIVDGKAYTTKNGELQTKEITSLPTKINFVTNNLERFKLTKETKVRGLIVTMDYPFIDEYKGIKIISLDQISKI